MPMLRLREAGMSLVEVLVSLVIGLVVVGAVMVNYLSTGLSGKTQSAYSQMAEDAHIAFTILGRDLSLAGYSRAVAIASSPSGTPSISRAFSGRPVFGCDTGFSNPAGATTTIACGTSTNHAIEVVYEADQWNSLSVTSPRDCLGTTISTSVVSGTVTATIAYNRYYVATSTANQPELHCAGGASAVVNNTQPLIENVEVMKLWYGEATSANPRQVVRYVSASSVADWNRVVSVRICLLMRSAEAVLTSSESETLGYKDCDLSSQTSSDRYARRAFFTTIALRNKVAY